MTISAISFTADELALIASLCPAGTAIDSAVWGAEAIKDLKASIKTHYIAAQGSRCCYCDRHLGSENHRIWDIDHIVPRATHPHFIFEPKNLAASCPDCNGAKRDASVLTNNRRKTYPKKSDAFKIIHAHFDSFGDHIHRDELVYLPKTAKGKQTIYSCDLLRFAQKYINWPTSLSDDRFEAEVDAVMAGGPSATAALAQINQSIRAH